MHLFDMKNKFRALKTLISIGANADSPAFRSQAQRSNAYYAKTQPELHIYVSLSYCSMSCVG